MREIFSAAELASTRPQGRGETIVFQGDQYRAIGMTPGAFEKISSNFPSTGLDVTVGGTPLYPFPFVVFQGAVQIQGSFVSDKNDRGIDVFAYTEGNVLSSRNVTSLSFNDLVYITTLLAVTQLPTLTSAKFPKLKVVGGQVQVQQNALLTELTFPELVHVGNGNQFVGQNLVCSTLAALTTLAFPKLKAVGGAFQVTSAGAITSLSAPMLETTGNNVNVSAATLPTLTFPALKYCGFQLFAQGCSALTSWTMPILEYVGSNVNAASAGNIVTVQLGTAATLKAIGGDVNLSGNKLSQASVDHVLAQLALLDGTNGTTAYGAGKTVTLTGGTNATPSAAGLASKAIIVARGATVTNN